MDSFSPEWWRDRLMVALDAQVKRVTRLEKYNDDGFESLPDPPRGMTAEVFDEAKAAFLNLSKMGVTNWLQLIAKAPADRLAVRGFRFGDAKVDQRRGAQAWALWQANQLDSEFPLALETSFVTGQSYGLVWPSDEGPAVMTCEHPSEVIVGYASGSRRRRAAALKRWLAEDGRVMVNLYLPDALFKWQTAAAPLSSALVSTQLQLPASYVMGLGTLEPRRVAGEEWPLANPLGVVPVVEFAINAGLRARPFGGGRGEFEGVLAIQDRINKSVFDRLVTQEHQAFRQRWAIGWEPPVDPKTKQPDPRAAFRASQAALWTFPGGGSQDQPVQVGEFAQADFTHFIEADKNDVNAMAAITTTPPHYLLGAMVNISGDAITAAESGISSKTSKHARVLDDPIEEFVSLGLKADKNPAAADKSSMVLWDDIERRSWAQMVDGLVKLDGLGVPREELWAMVPGVTPQDVERWIEKAKATPPPAPSGAASQ